MKTMEEGVLAAPLAALDDIAKYIMPQGELITIPIQDLQVRCGQEDLLVALGCLGYAQQHRRNAALALASSIVVLRDLRNAILETGIDLAPECGKELGWKWVAIGAPMLTLGYRAGSMDADVSIGKSCMLRARILFAAPELGVFMTLYFKPDHGSAPLCPGVVSLEYSGIRDKWSVVMDDLVPADAPLRAAILNERSVHDILEGTALRFAAAVAETLHDSLR